MHFSADGKKIFSYRYDDSNDFVQVWHLDNKIMLCQCPGQLMGISRDAQTFLTKSGVETYQAWSSETGIELSLSSISVDTYERKHRSDLIADYGKRTLEVRDIINKEASKYFDLKQEIGDNTTFDDFKMSPDGTEIAIALYGGEGGHDWAEGISINMAGDIVRRFSVDRISKPILYFAEFHPILAVSSQRQKIELFSLDDKFKTHTVSYQDSDDLIRIGPHKRITIAFNTYTSFRVGRKVFEETERIVDIAFHPNGKLIASVMTDGVIHIHDLASLKLETALLPL